MTTRNCKTAILLAAALYLITFNVAQGVPSPQNRPPFFGFTGAFGQLFNGAVDATNAAGGAIANGASTGLQAFGNTAQDLFNGAIGGYNSASGGLVNGFQSFVGTNNSSTIR